MKPKLNHDPLSGIDDIAAAMTRLANRQGTAPESLISDLEDRLLGSPDRPAGHDVNRPTAYVGVADPEHPDTAELVMHVCRIGSYLAKGKEELRIPFNLHDQTAQTAVDRLFDSRQGTFTAIKIGERNYSLDSNLKFDVYSALMDYLARL
jgi:hypothetical protein